ncbi:ThiF family adenylyltransferase [Microbacterium sp. DT81.1]|uniref:ThiF family adenylyltransferase n=1 Tax=Microbacterium sp. DT81.1 TaxID=3393413 RepID=UPI003CF333B8
MPLPPLVEPIPALSPAERARTARHTSLAALGEVGQRRLAAAHVAVIGAGGLGSPVMLALAAAGVGTLTVIDDDAVEASNLQRQVMHRLSDVGSPKVASATRVAADLSPETRVLTREVRLSAENAADLLAGADLVIDGSDTFDTREAVAAACEQLGLPLVWGTVQAFDAQVTVFWSSPPEGFPAVRLSDLYPHGSTGDVPTCAMVGVLGALCMQVGSLMATEAIKLIAGIGEPLLGRVLVLDSLRSRQSEVPLRPGRTAASDHIARPTATSTASATANPATPAPVIPAPATPTPAIPAVASMSARELAEALASASPPALLDVREAFEVADEPMPGAHHVPLATVLGDPSAIAGPVVVVCQAGTRARRAAEALAAVGVPATVLTGGMNAWRQAFADRTA